MRVVWISLISVLSLLLVLFGIRIWSLSLPIVRYQHAFWNVANPQIAVRVRNANEARSLTDPNTILWIDVRTTRDHKFFVLPPGDLRATLNPEKLGADHYFGPQNYNYNLSDLRPFFPDAPLLEDLLKEFPKRRLILNVVDNAQGIHEDLVKLLEPYSPDERILIQSDTDVLLRSIKELKPLWIYGTSYADIMRLVSFDSIGLTPAAPFKGDVFITPVKMQNRNVLEASVLDEIRRRQKNILIGPLQNDAEYETAQAYKPDGYIFQSPELERSIRGKEAK